MPDPPPSEDDLLKLGLPRDGVLALLASSDPGPRWCTIEQTMERSVTACVPSRVRIHTPAVGQSSQVVLSLSRNDSGEVDLVGLRAAS